MTFWDYYWYIIVCVVYNMIHALVQNEGYLQKPTTLNLLHQSAIKAQHSIIIIILSKIEMQVSNFNLKTPQCL